MVFRNNFINFALDSGCRKAKRVGASKIQNKELTAYPRSGTSETYNVTSVTHVNGKGDSTGYIISVE